MYFLGEGSGELGIWHDINITYEAIKERRRSQFPSKSLAFDMLITQPCTLSLPRRYQVNPASSSERVSKRKQQVCLKFPHESVWRGPDKSWSTESHGLGVQP